MLVSKIAEVNKTMCCRMLISRACCMAYAFDSFRMCLFTD